MFNIAKRKNFSPTRVRPEEQLNDNQVPVLRTTHGIQMNFKVDEQCEIYFKNLQECWDVKFTVRK